MLLSLTDLWKGPSRRDSVVHFRLERPYKWHLLPKVPFKDAKMPIGIHLMFYLHITVSDMTMVLYKV